MSAKKLRLGVNIDHVATIRNARGGKHPDPVKAALMAVEAGADGITAHLREDRRHIRDDDISRLREQLTKPLNFEMAATREMVDIALKARPHAACIVPERRQELTTEGGLDVIGQHNHLVPIIAELKAAGIRVSLFIAADPKQIETAAMVGAPVIEIHTGAWCEAVIDGHETMARMELERITKGATLAKKLGLEIHAGHGLDLTTAETISALPQVVELNIGHFLIGEAIFGGLTGTIAAMRAAMERGLAKRPGS
jgi:pyridoxine 5-phosphate synthase